MEFQWSSFKSWKMMLRKCCTQYASKFGKLSSGHRTGPHPPPKKGNDKEGSNYHTTALISHASKVCSKFPKPGFNSMWTENFQMSKLDLEKAEEPDVKLPTSIGSLKKQEFQKNICFTDYTKAFDCYLLLLFHNKPRKILQEMGINTRPPDLPLEKSVCRLTSNS